MFLEVTVLTEAVLLCTMAMILHSNLPADQTNTGLLSEVKCSGCYLPALHAYPAVCFCP